MIDEYLILGGLCLINLMIIAALCIKKRAPELIIGYCELALQLFGIG